MIITQIRPLSIGRSPNNLLRSRIRVLNEQARATAREMRNQCKHDRCEEHCEQDSLITVVPHWDGRFTFEKTDFCCGAFARQYSFEETSWIDALEETAQDAAVKHQLRFWPERA